MLSPKYTLVSLIYHSNFRAMVYIEIWDNSENLKCIYFCTLFRVYGLIVHPVALKKLSILILTNAYNDSSIIIAHALSLRRL